MDTPPPSAPPWQQVATAPTCPECGRTSLAGGKTCEWCGAVLDPPPAPGDSGAPLPQPARADLFSPWASVLQGQHDTPLPVVPFAPATDRTAAADVAGAPREVPAVAERRPVVHAAAPVRAPGAPVVPEPVAPEPPVEPRDVAGSSGGDRPEPLVVPVVDPGQVDPGPVAPPVVPGPAVITPGVAAGPGVPAPVGTAPAPDAPPAVTDAPAVAGPGAVTAATPVAVPAPRLPAPPVPDAVVSPVPAAVSQIPAAVAPPVPVVPAPATPVVVAPATPGTTPIAVRGTTPVAASPIGGLPPQATVTDPAVPAPVGAAASPSAPGAPTAATGPALPGQVASTPASPATVAAPGETPLPAGIPVTGEVTAPTTPGGAPVPGPARAVLLAVYRAGDVLPEVAPGVLDVEPTPGRPAQPEAPAVPRAPNGPQIAYPFTPRPAIWTP